MLILPSMAAPVIGADASLEDLEEQAFKEAVARVAPSVVRIETVGGLDEVSGLLTGTGPTTGVVVSADGYIITSAFNFINQPASILVELPDGRRFPAERIATDHLKMLTLLKIEADDLQPPEPAPESSIGVGQWSLALGRTYDSPLPSLSVGIVSALNRVWGKAIQTDAKVSPVNYGGPLVDVRGRVMGILVPLSPKADRKTAGVEWYDSGIGFAIPMQDIEETLERLKSGEDLHPGRMGITLQRGSLYTTRPVIAHVRSGSPAAETGLQAGDVLQKVQGQPVRRKAQVRQVLGDAYAGQTVALSVQRDEETIETQLTLVDELQPYESGFLGILPFRKSGADEAAGVGVRYVYPDSPAAGADLAKRDRIVQFAGKKVTAIGTLINLVGRHQPGETVSLVYRRDGEKTNLDVKLDSLPNSVPEELSPTAVASLSTENNGPNEDDDPNNENGPKTGRFTRSMPAHDHSYWAYVPGDYQPGDQYGLMVWIHPSGDTMQAAVLDKWKTICDRRGLILLGPKASKIGGWQPNEAEFVQAAVEEIRDNYGLDENRIFLHSFSDGSRFAYHLAFKYRELFRGAAIVAGHLRMRPPENRPEYRFHLHLVCGKQDERFPSVKKTVEALRKRKFPVSFRPLDDHRHAYPPAEAVREIGRWADCLDRI